MTTQSECHVILCVGSPYPKSTPLSLGSIGLVKVKIQWFWLVTWPHGWCVTWLCSWGPLILSHHPTKFGIHRPRESGDKTFFICHVTMISIWVSCDFVGGVPLFWVTTQLSLGSIDLIKLEIITFVISSSSLLLLLLLLLLFNIWSRSETILHVKMDYLNLEKNIYK